MLRSVGLGLGFLLMRTGTRRLYPFGDTGYSGSYVTPGLMLPAGLLVTLRVPELGVPTKGARAARETFAWVCNLAAKPSLDAKRLSGPSGDPHGHGHGCCCLGLSDPRLLHTRDQQAHAA